MADPVVGRTRERHHGTEYIELYVEGMNTMTRMDRQSAIRALNGALRFPISHAPTNSWERSNLKRTSLTGMLRSSPDIFRWTITASQRLSVSLSFDFVRAISTQLSSWQAVLQFSLLTLSNPSLLWVSLFCSKMSTRRYRLSREPSRLRSPRTRKRSIAWAVDFERMVASREFWSYGTRP